MKGQTDNVYLDETYKIIFRKSFVPIPKRNHYTDSHLTDPVATHIQIYTSIYCRFYEGC